MALKKPTFENEPDAQAQGDTAVAEAPAKTVAPAAAVDPAAAATATTTALAKASATSLSVADAANAAKAFKKEVEDMKGSSDFTYGDYDVFKADGGGISQTGAGKDMKLGRWAKVRLMGWDNSYQVSPGAEGASTKDFVAYSKDGKTIDSVIGEELKSWAGKPVQDYVQYLEKEEEFSNVKVRPFIDTACFLLGTESGDGPVGKTVQITLSKTSMSSFSRYQQELVDNARAVSMGLPFAKLPEDPFTFYFIVERVQDAKGKKWDKLKIEAVLPAKL